MAESVTIKVMCRFRPLNSNEKERKDKFLPAFPADDQIKLDGRTYKFDRVFNEKTQQETVYKHAAQPIVKDVLTGFNGTIFAYGQTASGKTHTMEGVLHDPSMSGIIPRIVDDIFNHIYAMDESIEFHIKVSYFEVYLDKIRDLLDITKANLPVHEDANRVPYVKGATERFVASPEDVMDVVDEGKSNRAVASTQMNSESSRSHSIFLIQVSQENRQAETKLTGKLYLVDLAGSEKVGKTGAEGVVLDEAKNINKSLSALGNVISALAEGTKTHIPYRDSKMTRILQEALGGNCRTTIIICASPAGYNEAETKSTLMFGVRAKTIKNSVVANVELTAEQWRRKYEKEREKNKKANAQIDLLKEELARWRRGDQVPLGEQVNDEQLTKALTNKPDAVVFDLSLGQGDGSSQPQSACPTPISSDKRNISSTETTELYQILDEKDDEIHNLSRLNEQLKVQLLDQESVLSSMRGSDDRYTSEFQQLSQELTNSKEEVSDLMRALEDLALSYEQKAGALSEAFREREQMEDEVRRKDEQNVTLISELELLKEENSEIQTRTTETMSSLLRDLSDMGMAVNPENNELAPKKVENGSSMLSIFESHWQSDSQPSESEFTAARLLISKMKGEVLQVINRAKQAETNLTDQHKLTETKDKELHEYREKVKQYEQRSVELQQDYNETETNKRHLEDQLDQLTAELDCLKQQEKKAQALAATQSESVDKFRDSMEQQLESNREFHARQVTRLRNEIESKHKQVETLRSRNTEACTEADRIKIEYATLQQTAKERDDRLKELSVKVEQTDQAKNDLRGLEETVGRELQTLHSLRRMFVKDLRERVRKAQGENSDVDMVEGSTAQKHRIGFLETNLNQLTSVHKQLVRDNADLRCELPKLEKRLRATADRVRSLETALRDAREGALKDRRKYQGEVEKIKEAVRARHIARRAQQPNIARPVRRPDASGGLPLGGTGIRRPVARPGSTLSGQSQEPQGGIRKWAASQQRS